MTADMMSLAFQLHHSNSSTRYFLTRHAWLRPSLHVSPWYPWQEREQVSSSLCGQRKPRWGAAKGVSSGKEMGFAGSSPLRISAGLRLVSPMLPLFLFSRLRSAPGQTPEGLSNAYTESSESQG